VTGTLGLRSLARRPAVLIGPLLVLWLLLVLLLLLALLLLLGRAWRRLLLA